MKGKWFVTLGISLFILCGCVNSEFFVYFSLPENVEANYNVVYYADSKKGGMFFQTVAPVIGGQCELRGVTALPTLLYLSGNKFRVPVIVYARKGDKIKITGDDANPYLWTVIGGDKINERLSEWRNEYADTLMRANPVEVNAAVENFVVTNPGDPVSTILLLTNFYKDKDETLYNDLWRRLNGEATAEKWINLIGAADQLNREIRHPARLRSMVMRSYPGKLDTLIPSSSKASMLLFWEAGMDNRMAFFDSLRSIAGEFPDSSSRLIADICVGSDSIAWCSQLRSDTVELVSRLWVPEGLANRNLMALNVKKTPYYIVLSSDGYQQYRGNVLDSAFYRFRSIMNDTVAK